MPPRASMFKRIANQLHGLSDDVKLVPAKVVPAKLPSGVSSATKAAPAAPVNIWRDSIGARPELLGAAVGMGVGGKLGYDDGYGSNQLGKGLMGAAAGSALGIGGGHALRRLLAAAI